MLTLLREEACTDEFTKRWRIAALAYFHELALRNLSTTLRQ